MAERLVIEANYAKHNNQSVTLKSIGTDAFQYKSLKMMCQLTLLTLYKMNTGANFLKIKLHR